MKLVVVEDENFSCKSCTNCCRDWHVELLADDAQRIGNLVWPEGDVLRQAQVFLRHSGKTYLAHQPDGACVFLNIQNGLCRIHEQFGGSIKPLGCRLYPFQLTPTFAGDVSVTARYDCPAVRQNNGLPHTQSLHDLNRLAQSIALPDKFDQSTCCNLDPDQIQAVCEFVTTLMEGFSRSDQRALFMAYLCDWLGGTAVDELDRAALANAFGQIKGRVEAACAKTTTRPGLIHRMTFRTVLGLYLRRDEDVLDGRAGRLNRVWAMTAFVLGFGKFTGLGVNHPQGTLAKAKLFAASAERPSADLFALHWRMVKTKLASMQFMGSANPGHDFISGLRSLALLYPLVLAAARYRAENRGSSLIESADVDYAVAAIEHSFGRSPILAQPFVRSLETVLMDEDVFARLIGSV